MTLTNSNTGVSYNNERKNKILSFIICCQIFLPSLNNFINSFIQLGLDIKWSILTPAVYIFIALCGAYALLKYWYKNTSIFCVAILIVMGIWLSYFIYPNIRDTIYGTFYDLVYNPMNKVMFFCIPALFAIVFIRDYEELFKQMQKWARLTLVVGVITFAFVSVYRQAEMQYMVYSYFMLTPICVCFEAFWSRHNAFDLVLAISGGFSILFLGARGAVVSLIVYLLTRMIALNIRKGTAQRVISLFFAFFVVVGFVLFYNDLFSFLWDVSKQLGIESRVLSSLAHGSLTESSGRDAIVDTIQKALANNPFGYGLFGDYYATNAYGFSSTIYAHNLFWEFWVDFGVVGGTILLFIFFYQLLKALVLNNSMYNRVLWAIIPYGLFQLMFSASTVANILFYLICGMLYAKKFIKL